LTLELLGKSLHSGFAIRDATPRNPSIDGALLVQPQPS